MGIDQKRAPIPEVAVSASAAIGGVASLFAWLIQPMLDHLFIDRDARTIFWMPLIIVGLFVVRGIATFCADYSLARIGREVARGCPGRLDGGADDHVSGGCADLPHAGLWPAAGRRAAVLADRRHRPDPVRFP